MKKTAVMTLCLLLFTPPAWAQVKSTDPFSEKDAFKRWYFSIGPNAAIIDSGVSVGINSVGLGLNLDVEKLLGLDTGTFSLRVEGAYRTGETGRHRVGVSWSSFRRSGENTLTEGITLPPELDPDETELLPGTTPKGAFDIDIINTTYRYSIILDDRIDLNIGGGLYIAPITIGVGIEGEDFAETDLIAPLPVLGIGLTTALSERWYAIAQSNLMYIRINNFRGAITNSMVGVEYRPFKNVGFGLRAESLRLGVEVVDESDIPGLGDFVGDINFSFVGASLYVSAFL